MKSFSDMGDFSERNVLMLGMLILALLYCIYGLDCATSDVIVFYEISEKFLGGEIPYRDFSTGYPPLSLIFFMFPRLFTSDINTYAAIFAAVNTVMFFLTLYCLVKICSMRNINRTVVSVLFLLMVSLYYEAAIRKFDASVGLFVVLSIFLFLKRKYFWATTAAFAGAMIKIAPALLIPVFLIISIRCKECRKGVLASTALCAIIVLFAVTVLVIAGFDIGAITQFIESNSTRGFHQESTVAAVAMLIAKLGGPPFSMVESNYTYDVSAPLCDALVDIWTYVMIIAVILVLMILAYAVSKKGVGETGEEQLKMIVAGTLATMIVFLLFSKVFSTQFILWIYPLIVLFAGYRNRCGTIVVCVLSVAMVLLSTSYLGNHKVWILLVRDAILTLFMIESIYYTLRREELLSKFVSDFQVFCSALHR